MDAFRNREDIRNRLQQLTERVKGSVVEDVIVEELTTPWTLTGEAFKYTLRLVRPDGTRGHLETIVRANERDIISTYVSIYFDKTTELFL